MVDITHHLAYRQRIDWILFNFVLIINKNIYTYMLSSGLS